MLIRKIYILNKESSNVLAYFTLQLDNLILNNIKLIKNDGVVTIQEPGAYITDIKGVTKFVKQFHIQGEVRDRAINLAHMVYRRKLDWFKEHCKPNDKEETRYVNKGKSQAL